MAAACAGSRGDTLTQQSKMPAAAAVTLSACEDRTRRPEEVNGSRSKFLRNFKTVGRYPKVTANPQTEISENSYGQTISTPKTRIATWKQKRENQLKTKQLRHRPV